MSKIEGQSRTYRIRYNAEDYDRMIRMVSNFKINTYKNTEDAWPDECAAYIRATDDEILLLKLSINKFRYYEMMGGWL